jgi:hypothetical protein
LISPQLPAGNDPLTDELCCVHVVIDMPEFNRVSDVIPTSRKPQPSASASIKHGWKS